MRLPSTITAALFAGWFGLLAWWFTLVGVRLALLTLHRLHDGNAWSPLLLLGAVAALAVARAASRELASALVAARR
ncbi:MAG: hypothetical protein EXR63_01485 [Dehalococcoidia bacterium]|nr:hypothetical protein [Dehalococcoidia bacterium]